jgi:hypothetical protein
MAIAEAMFPKYQPQPRRFAVRKAHQPAFAVVTEDGEAEQIRCFQQRMVGAKLVLPLKAVPLIAPRAGGFSRSSSDDHWFLRIIGFLTNF